MILAIVALALIALISLIAFYISFKKSQLMGNKKIILYYLAFSILISLGGLIAMSPATAESMRYFFLLQAGYAALGFLASFLFRRYVPEELGKARFAPVFFVLANAFIGMIGFTLVYHYFQPSGLAPWYALCVLPFVLPQFLSTAFAAYRAIPQAIYKVWYFPLHEDEVDYDKVDTSTIYMLELEYSRSINDPSLTNTKLRAPVSMKFGDWFRSFIESYNYKHDSEPIQFTDTDQTPLGWIFYVKPSLLGASRHIDPDLTITENRISEKNIIQAKRVGIVEEVAGN